MTPINAFETNFITAVDGTTIGFRQIGAGPGLILLHGGLQSSLNFTNLAGELAKYFTVYLPDRRGRGLSGAYKPDDNLTTEANGLLALSRYTNAPNIFALSAGAVITLQASLIAPVFKKIALFEPPLLLNARPFIKLGKAYKAAMAERNLDKAFIAILKGTGDPGISLLNTLPAFITAPLVNMLMKSQLKKRTDSELPLQELVVAFDHELILINESERLLKELKHIRADVLLLGGAKSQKYFKPVLNLLSSSLPHIRQVEFENMGHLAADNSESPLEVAKELMGFFIETNTDILKPGFA